MKDILIFGAGGFGREVLWTIEDINKDKKQWNVLGFIDDTKELWGTELHGYEIFEPGKFINNTKNKYRIVNGIGSCYGKYSIAQRFKLPNFEYANIIHPSVLMSHSVNLDGEGIIIQAGSIITVDIVIKSHVTINIDVTIGHDCFLDEYVTVAPGVHLSGCVNIGYGTDIGTGAAIIQKINIGSECVVGANASVIRDIPSNSVAVGVPAKVIKNMQSKFDCM